MKQMCVMQAALVCSVVFVAAACTAEPKADPRQKLETAIPEAIRLLEAKEYETLLKTYIPPDELKKINEEGALPKILKGFEADKAIDLLRILKEIKDQKPTLDANGMKATFKLKETEKTGRDTITFVLIDKLWYIGN
jgi:hypothetical protein